MSSTGRRQGPLHGTVAAIITPLDSHAHLDLSSVPRVCRFLTAAGVDGLFVGGTTGEGLLLSLDERMALAEAVLDAATVPVVIHVGAHTTAETVALIHHAAARGAAGIAIMTPHFYPLDDLALECHFAAAAAAAPALPRYVYTIPQFTGNALSLRLAARLCTAHGYVGIKYSKCDLGGLRSLLGTVAGDVLIGCDALVLDALRLGAVGTVSGGAGAFPELFVRLYRAFREGRAADAEEAQARIDSVDRVVAAMPFVSAYKAILRHRGVIPHAAVRPPLRGLSDDEWARLARVMDGLEVIHA